MSMALKHESLHACICESLAEFSSYNVSDVLVNVQSVSMIIAYLSMIVQVSFVCVSIPQCHFSVKAEKMTSSKDHVNTVNGKEPIIPEPMHIVSIDELVMATPI